MRARTVIESSSASGTGGGEVGVGVAGGPVMTVVGIVTMRTSMAVNSAVLALVAIRTVG